MEDCIGILVVQTLITLDIILIFFQMDLESQVEIMTIIMHHQIMFMLHGQKHQQLTYMVDSPTQDN